MKRPTKFLYAASAVLIVAVALRACRLDVRPMHGDEAVHAYKFGQLLEQNYYRYNPHEFHGPALNYFTLIPAWLSGKHTYAAVTESMLRIVPVLFGLLLVVMPLLLADGLGKTAALIASAIAAISPAFVYYSRYYIPEMLLVCFAFGVILAGYKYARSRKAIWALLAGLFIGLCYATKETCVIAFGSMIFALFVTCLLHRGNQIKSVDVPAKIKIVHLVVASLLAVCVAAVFFSSFLTNLSWALDSFGAYTTYFNRAGHNRIHLHPWYYYLQLLTWSKSATGPPWTEAFVVILAAIGVILIVARKGLAKLDTCLLDFLVLYAIFMLVVYSAIPYKTPWCLLNFYQPMILLAAVGIVAILNLLERKLTRVVVALFFVTLATDLGLQAFLASSIQYADPNNPYAYVQPTADVLKIAVRVEQVSNAHPARREMPVWVVCPDGDYWPLPWYLRSFKNVGWWNDVNEVPLPAPVVIASASLQDRLIARLFDLSPSGKKNLYVPLFDSHIELRPGVELRGYITKDLLDDYRRTNAAGH